MQKTICLFICLTLSYCANLVCQNGFKIDNSDKILSSNEAKSIENAIQYEMDFYGQIFSDIKPNFSDVRFVIVTNLVDFVNLQVNISKSAHINAAGFYSSKDSMLVVLKNKQTPSKQFLATCYHELSHTFLHIYANDQYTPPWFNEGMAEYLELMSYDKKIITHRTDKYKINRVKSLIELKDLNVFDFVRWNYQKFSEESFSHEGYGYNVSYCMILFLMEKNKENAIEIFSHLVGNVSTIDIFDKYYEGGFKNFETEFIDFIQKY